MGGKAWYNTRMKDITTFLIGGVIAIALAPFIGMLLTAIGCMLQMVGMYLSNFPSFF